MRILTLVLSLVLIAASPYAAAKCNKINNLPTTINKPGKYCLEKDFEMNRSDGIVIDIQTDGVTIDLQGHIIDNTAAGNTTMATGISARDQQNTTVRNGTVAGFSSAVNLVPPFGGTESNTVEYIRALDNISHGIQAWGPGAVVRNNIVLNTVNESSRARGIESRGVGGVTIVNNVVDNTSGALATEGILVLSSMAVVRDNHVTGTSRTGSSSGTEPAAGISVSSPAVVRGNSVINESYHDADEGILVSGGSALCQDNLIIGFPTAIAGCSDAGGNDSLP